MSRPELVRNMMRTVDLDEEAISCASESWLGRLEGGRVVMVPRPVIEALCRALKCSPQERIELLVLADRNVLGDADGNPLQVAAALNYVMARLYSEAEELLAPLLSNQQLSQMSERDLLEITRTALNAIINEHKAKS